LTPSELKKGDRMDLKTVNIINTCAGLGSQRELMKRADATVDLTGVKGVRFCGEIKDFFGLNKKLKPLKTGISFLGSGDFHHLCLHFLSKLPVEPLLLLFDHHSDMMEPMPGTISCGSWVRVALREHKVKKCIAVGVNPKDEAFTGFAAEDKAVFFPENTCHEKQVSGVTEELLKHDGPVYISIDKDVLDPYEAYTNWDQGSLELDRLLDILKIVKKAKNIVGADICGEWAAPGDEIFYTWEDINKIRINQDANLKILDALLSAV